MTGQPLVEVAEAVGAGRDVEDRHEGALLGEAEEAVQLLGERLGRIGRRPEVSRRVHHEVDRSPEPAVVVVGVDANSRRRCGGEGHLELDGEPEDAQQLRVVAEEADELVEVPLRVAGFVDALALLVPHRGDVVAGDIGGAVGEHRSFRQCQGIVTRWRAGGEALGERRVEVEDRLGEVTARTHLQAIGGELPPIRRAVAGDRRFAVEHCIPRRRFGERGHSR